MKKIKIVVQTITPRRIVTIKRSTIVANITSLLYTLYNEGDFKAYHTIAQMAINGLHVKEKLRQAFIDGYSAVILGAESMMMIDQLYGADTPFTLVITDDQGNELVCFDSHDLNY